MATIQGQDGTAQGWERRQDNFIDGRERSTETGGCICEAARHQPGEAGGVGAAGRNGVGSVSSICDYAIVRVSLSIRYNDLNANDKRVLRNYDSHVL